MNKKGINTQAAPQAIGPYSQGVLSGSLLFLSGQIPINPQSGFIEAKEIKEQTIQVMENIKALLHSQKLDINHIIKTTVYITDMNNFSKVNEVYASYFTVPYPARSCVEISRLPKDALLEIEAVAVID